MSEPTPTELKALKDCGGDDERYHSTFDTLLEAKLMALDPEWMTAMTKLYEASGNCRWCA